MPELNGNVPERKTVYFCQRCGRATDNTSQLCDVCLEQKKLSPTGGSINMPQPTDYTSQNF